MMKMVNGGRDNLQNNADSKSPSYYHVWLSFKEIFGSENDINKIHLKFYCSSTHISVDGLNEIQDLLPNLSSR